ncbi:uncharacterized protein LOC142181886 [Nicotiana tabacum]|uniref:Uncharacterized protein LOC142181886 n=1 Tax=Nicotiana tabacum TaxID=4097 RepID=A0AC58UQ70_TOBAC
MDDEHTYCQCSTRNANHVHLEQYDQILKLINKNRGENTKGFAGTTKTFVTNETVKNENWIVDSGATNHMVHTRELLDNINTNILGNAPKVYLPNGTSLDVECTGESRIDLHSGKVKGIGKELEGLYNLQHQKLEAKAANVHLQDHSVQEEDLKVWHGRLGHAPDRVVRQIPNMKFKASRDGIKECTICPLARQGRLPFPKSTNVKFVEHIFPFQLLKEGKLKLFPNGVLDSPVTTNVVPSQSADVPEQARSPEDDTSFSVVPPIADNHAADAQPSSPHSLSFEDIQTQQLPFLKQDTFAPEEHNLRKSTRIAKEYQSYLSKITSIREPLNDEEAALDPKWIDAMTQELNELKDNATWTLIKYKANEEIEIYKARLVAKGYNQIEGLDYQETFSPTVKMVTVRVIIALATTNNWNVHQMDVYNAFLQGDLTGEQGTKLVIILVYVDDLLITGNDHGLISEAKAILQGNFKIKDLGELKFLLGIEISRSKEGILMNPRKFVIELIIGLGLAGSKPVSTPMECNQRFTTVEYDQHMN